MPPANTSKLRLGPSPWAENIGSLLEYGGKATSWSSKFEEMSDYVLNTLTSTRNAVILHIQPEGFPDHLLRLHILLQTIDRHRLFSIKERRDIALGVVVVVDSLNSSNNGFKQACWVASERTQHKGKEKCGGAVYLFGRDSNVVVVRGLAMNNQGSFKSAVSRLGQAIRNVMRGMKARAIVWHECATIALLARTLQEVYTKNERNIRIEHFKAICCTSGFTLNDSSCTINFGFENERARNALLSNLEKSRIPLVFLDSSTLGLPPNNSHTTTLNMSTSWNPFASHLPYFSIHWPRLLPIQSWRPVLGQGMDTLATTIFRLRATTISGEMGEGAVVQQVKRELGPNNHAISLVKPWAKKCINTISYTSSALMNLKLRLPTALWQACLLSSCPIDFPLDALVSGIVDPGAKDEEEEMMCLRVDINFSSPSVRVHAYSKIPTYILVPISSSSSFAANHLNQSWEHLIMQYPDPKKMATIPRGISESWENLAVAAMKNLQAVGKTKAYAQWGEEEKVLFGYVVQAIWGRAMTTIAAKSLGRHPMAIFTKQ
jgi:hypothetical protein